MQSDVARALKLQFIPVAILWSDSKPEGALEFKPGRWGCVMWMVAAAAKGKTAVFDRYTFGCYGGGTGLGFGNQFEHSPGGVEGFCYFLSTGVESAKDRGKFAADEQSFKTPSQADHFLHGERYRKSPDLVRKFIKTLPITDIPKKFVIFKPLDRVAQNETPLVIVFIARPHQIAALVTLVNYDQKDTDTVIVPPGAGCHQIALYAYKEAAAAKPRAVLGLTDISARKNVRQLLGDDVFTFTVPLPMFLQMEKNVPGSFLERPTWKSLRESL